ncbi:MAG: hypothetical protein OQL16_03780 [Gammaproteobacteria bacterium]|nr:hypothetical protein [Gammaproteobacteria bacterium]
MQHDRQTGKHPGYNYKNAITGKQAPGMNNKFIIAILLAILSCPGYSQENQEVSPETPAPIDASSALASITSLGGRIGKLIQGHFLSIEALAADEALIKAIKDEDTAKLDELAVNFQGRLEHSLRVRLYIKGKEEVDNDTTPACGFACIEIVRAAYRGKPDAEALLFRSPDANITMVRGIKDQNGEAIGAIVAHYPFLRLKDEVEKLTTHGLFTELRQHVTGPAVVLFNHGDRTVKQGAAQKIIRIPHTRWAIAVWTPGGISVEEYEAPSLPWMSIIMAIVVLIGGIAFLVIYHIKHPVAAKPKKVRHTEAMSSEVISYDTEHDSKTLIMGGGAKEVDVSKYLKDDDITSVKIKVK